MIKLEELRTYGSAFSGIGGLDIAIGRVFGAEPLWHVEPDPYASAVLAKHWPDVPNLHRIEEVDEHVERPDIICGGFPCQDISPAGRRAGLDGTRSGLWWELARVIGVLRPRIVVLENVAALAVRGLDAVIGELSRLRYDAAWGVLRASDVGAPHRRARMFIVAADGTLSDFDFLRLRGRSRGLAQGDSLNLANTDKERRGRTADQKISSWPEQEYREDALRGHNSVRCNGRAQWPPGPYDTAAWSRWSGALPGVRRGTYGHSRGLDARVRRERIRCLGNGVVPDQAAEAIIQLWGRLQDVPRRLFTLA